MARTVVVIVSGPPGSGKTTLGRMVARRFRLPFINKDGIKEPLGDVFGTGNREWSQKLGMASFELLYVFCERLLEAQVSHMIEGNFRPESATEKFRELKAKYDFEPFEIHCLAETGVIIERYQARDANGERHPIHMDSMRAGELERALHAGLHGPLELGGTVYKLDTTDFGALDYNSLFAALEEVLGRG